MAGIFTNPLSSPFKEQLTFYREFPSAIEPNRGTSLAAGIDIFVPKPTVTDKIALDFMREKCIDSVTGLPREDEEIRTINNRFDSYEEMDPEVGFLHAVIQYNARVFGHTFKLAFPNTLSNYIQLAPGESITIPTGLSASIPHNYALDFKNKSGIASKQDLLVGACLIDEDYKGIMHMNLHNVGNSNRSIKCGQKLVQACLIRTWLDDVNVDCVDGHITETSDRGEGGFGSTGTTA